MSKSAWLLVLALIFFVHENNYFGWNRLPQSPEELLADGIVVLLVAMSVLGRKE